MPLFYVRLEGPFPFEDLEGEHFESVDEARAAAVAFLAEMLLDRCTEVHVGEAWRVSVRDQYRIPVLEMAFDAN